MSLPAAIIVVLAHFEPCFSQATWRKAVLLLVGTLLARGRRTVAAALRLTGQTLDPNFALFHHVLNRARWVPLAVVADCCSCSLRPLCRSVRLSRSSLMKP